MMKSSILFILHLPPPVHGAAMVGKYIHDSKLINSSFDCHYINLTTAKDLQDIGKSGVGKMWRFVRLLWRIRRTLKRVKPQLVYVTPNACGGAFYKDFVVVQMLKACGCRVVCHYHNKGVKTRQDRWLDDRLYRRFFKGVNVVLLANALYDDIRKYVKREDVYICPNGIPETVTEKLPKPQNEISRLLFLSNLLIEKGVFVLLDALKILKDKGCSFICDFVGGETTEIDAERIRAEVEKRGLNDVMAYCGRKYGEEKDSFLRKADIFVFPTYYHNECFPLVLLEAMQYGKVCIATAEGGIADIVNDGVTGFLVEKQNSEQLVEKIGCLMSDKDLCYAMGQAGRKKYEKDFTLSCFEKTLRGILGRIVEDIV